MAALTKFQAEIEEIRHREQAKPTLVAKQTPAAPSSKSTKGHEHKSKPVSTEAKQTPLTEAPKHIDSATNGQTEPSIDEADIINLLVSSNPEDHEQARDRLAALLTMSHGEYVLHVGAQPSHEQLFNLPSRTHTTGAQPKGTKAPAVPSSASDPEPSWTGQERTAEEVAQALETLGKIIEGIGGKSSVLFQATDEHPRAILLLRLPPLSVAPEVRCAVVGNVDSGKSTTLGVLTNGVLDDGRGRARVQLFRHKHEIETGRTSSVGMEILGFDTNGSPIYPHVVAKANEADTTAKREKLGWDQISTQAAKIVSFIDLAGHERYLKTTLYGLTSGAPSCVVLVVGANAGLIGMSKEHLAVTLALAVPFIICITKIDMTPQNVLRQTVAEVAKLVKSPGCRKSPVFVESAETAIALSSSFSQEKLCPIFQLSNVTGKGLDFLRIFLNLLPSSELDSDKYSIDRPLEYSVTDVWSVPYVGTVVNGIVNSGSLKIGDQIMFGPDYNGHFLNTSIKDMQRKRASVKSADAGQCVSLALKRVKKAEIRKGMVIMHKAEALPTAYRRFEAQVLILYHNTTLQASYQAMLHCGAVRQTVRIVSIESAGGVLRTGDRSTVIFEFITHPEFIKVGMKLIFRESKTKGLGVITKLLTAEETGQQRLS